MDKNLFSSVVFFFVFRVLISVLIYYLRLLYATDECILIIPLCKWVQCESARGVYDFHHWR